VSFRENLFSNRYHLYPRNLGLYPFLYGPDQVHAGNVSAPAVAGRPYPYILTFYVNEFDIAAERYIVRFDLFNYSLDFLDVLFYIFHSVLKQSKIFYQIGAFLDILDIITTRRSVRKFDDKPVPEELLRAILEAGRWAPSGMNNQPWKFAVIEDRRINEEISKLTRYAGIVRSAGFLIAVFLDNAESYHRTKDVQAVGACIQNMLLEAHSLGLGAVWLGEIIKSDKEIRTLLGIEADLEFMALIALGYPSEKPRGVKRRELKDLIVYRE
jgi:nitroreductase